MSNTVTETQQPLLEGKGEEKQTQYKASMSDYLLMLGQIGLLVVWTFCAQYDQGVLPGTTKPAANSNVYACFQDVNVMIFIGFGYLMTYLKAQGQTALSFNWIISIWCIQWGILSQAFFQQLFAGGSLTKIAISLDSLIWGLFAAATAMITYGALLGKCTIQQLLWLTFWEMGFWGLNVAICTQWLLATDMGGSIIIHAFGCYFGLAASYHFQTHRASGEQAHNNASSHNSEIIALIGSIFLWMFWPSFNGALAANGAQQNRVFCNTNLAIAAGCIGAAFTSRLFYNKLEMTIIMNATLAGGVAVGTCSDLITSPGGAMWLGFIAGILSAVGFEKIGPYLEGKINLQDTCGVGSLHGMPGLLGGIASIIAVAIVADEFPKGAGVFPAMDAKGGSKIDQVMAQLYMVLITFFFAGSAGFFTGFACKTGLFSQPQVLFKDDDHMHDVVNRYSEDLKDLSEKKDD